MEIALSEYIKKLETSRKNLNNVKSLQLHSESNRNEIRKLVEIYFNSIRPGIIDNGEINPNIQKVDKQFQELLELCHKKGLTRGYKLKLTTIRSILIAVDAQLVTFPITQTSQIRYNSIDLQIIETLRKILPSAAAAYLQAIEDLLLESRHSWRGPATDIRESLRETLDHLAPDADVMNLPGYKQEINTSGPTMKQKVQCILKKRRISKTQRGTTEDAVEAIELSIGDFVRSVYTESNISTHTQTGKQAVVRIRNYARAAFCELLEIQD